MPQLTERAWRLKYTPDDGNLVEQFYVPALECAVRYDRSTGYFNAPALALAMRGIEGLIRNDGRMRLIVGCTLEEKELAAIEKGESLRDAIANHLQAAPLEPPDNAARDALELLAWMIANRYLDVKVAVPCDAQRRPMNAQGIFHEKAGIIEDAANNRLAFNGSVNETVAGWRRNWESFSVFTSWTGTVEHAALEAQNFAKLWANQAKYALTVDVPEAASADLLRFMPQSDLPARLAQVELPPEAHPTTLTQPRGAAVKRDAVELRRAVWSYIDRAPTLPDGGSRVGEATCGIQPWPHQVRAFERLYAMESPRLIIADEVGLGKTIQAGMLLRQMWMARRAQRILILTPAAVMHQWQLELREKFNLNWPIYDDGKLQWYPSPALRHGAERKVSSLEWHHENIVIASSHLMRRADRARDLCEVAEPWDLIVLDEAHHARRKGAGSSSEEGPNALLRLMQRLERRTKGLVLLTATPMQVHPIEVWDLLNLLGLPAAWGSGAFLRFFELIGSSTPSHEEFDELATMFRATEAAYGETSIAALGRFGVTSPVRARRILAALRDAVSIRRRQMDYDDKAVARQLMRTVTPVSRLVSRHTRDLLRRYHKAGHLPTRIADRDVRDVFVAMTTAERALYDAVENYISTTYNQASAEAKNAVGFVMTVYRRRLASSFRALRETLAHRLAPLAAGPATSARQLAFADDVSDDDSADQGDDVMDADDAAKLERQALEREERIDIERLLRQVRALPPDSKARQLASTLAELARDGYRQVMVFTQFTDTMDFLRGYLLSQGVASILCFSGRGGEERGTDGRWSAVSRETVKQRFRQGNADVLLCTDAAAEGLNFQFCGALVNYDMPWNPMRVEQRIGRIDRLGQENATVRIVNLHYEHTVETDVYVALRNRIGLFQSVVGRLQPILAQLPRTIADSVLRNGPPTDDARARIASDVSSRVDALRVAQTGLDLDVMADDVLDLPERPQPALDLHDLDGVLRRDTLLPPGVVIRSLGSREYGYRAPGMSEELRVTTSAEFFDAHGESVELWSPGSPLFPASHALAEGDTSHPSEPAAWHLGFTNLLAEVDALQRTTTTIATTAATTVNS